MSTGQANGLDLRSSHHDPVPPPAIATRRRIVSSREIEETQLLARAAAEAGREPRSWEAQQEVCCRLVDRELRRLEEESEAVTLAGARLSDEQWARLREVTATVRQNVAAAARAGGEDPNEVPTERLMRGAR
jgi:hypothetical protein